MMFKAPTTALMALAISFTSMALAAPTEKGLQTRETTCTGVSEIVVGEYCENVTGDTQDPDISACSGFLQQLDSNGNIVGNVSIGGADNYGFNNSTNFCNDYDLVTGQKNVEFTSCNTTWIYTLEDCVNGTSLYLIQSEGGATKGVTMAYDTSIVLPEVPYVGVWYTKFVVAESAFA